MGTGDGGVTFVCARLTDSFQDRYFGTPRVTYISHGPGNAEVTVRGTVNGRSVTRTYRLGEEQFRNWTQLECRTLAGVLRVWPCRALSQTGMAGT
jgi:hypothetical protein